MAFLARSGGEDVRSRLQLAEALIEAERKFIAAQSVSIYDGTYLGDYGSKMRQMIEGEYALLENRRSAARKANVTTAVAALALIGSIYAATASGAIGGIAMQSFSGILVLGSLWAMSSTLETRAESAQMSENFLALIAPALERQISVQMEWLESKERIAYALCRPVTTADAGSGIRRSTPRVVGMAPAGKGWPTGGDTA